jgi:hypothetical protein
MADQKISQLAALTGANLATDDEFVVVDTSTTSTKRMTSAELKLGLFASPALTGTPTAPTAATTTNTTQIATTAFVQQEIAANPAGLVFLATADAANDATIDFTAFDGATYDAYMFQLSNVVPATDNVSLGVRLSTDGGSSFLSGASDYGYAFLVGSTSSTSSASDSMRLVITNNLGSAAGEDGWSGTVFVHGPHLTKRTHISFNGAGVSTTGALVSFMGSGQSAASAAHNAIRFFMSAGNIESGTITMYGLRNA